MHILMTGGTQGFGAFAAKRLVDDGHQLTIAVRDAGRLPEGLAGRVAIYPLDLDRIDMAGRFADAIASGPRPDVLLLNAGLQLAKPAKSANGFERTFAVNHLAHFLILSRLAPLLAQGARVVLTGSGTHDPAEKTPVTPPVHANAEWLAYPELDPTAEKSTRKAAFRAYSSSKLANIMTAREAAKRFPALSVMSYDPGYVPWTGLGRANGPILAALASLIIPMMMNKDRSSTVPRSGGYLADLAVAADYGDCHGDYWSVRGGQLLAIPPSELARDDAACAKLWDDSARMVAGVV
jgi:NAD(P)-dependent dehydrogenase (short-subunit alcohol dehydrogenase family)